MLTPFYEKLHITDTVSVIIVSIALMLICGFAATRVTKRLRLPNVTAYIVARWHSSRSAPANSSNSTR